MREQLYHCVVFAVRPVFSFVFVCLNSHCIFSSKIFKYTTSVPSQTLPLHNSRQKFRFINICIFFFLLFAGDCSSDRFSKYRTRIVAEVVLKGEDFARQKIGLHFIVFFSLLFSPQPHPPTRNHVWSISSYNSRRHRLCALDDLIKLKAYFTIGYNPNEILMIQPWSQHIIIRFQT